MMHTMENALEKPGSGSTRIDASVQDEDTSPYEALKGLERYTEQTVQLLGEDFRIADSLSFYYSHQEIFLNEIYKFESSRECPVILDCGSNYGTSLVYFKSIHPESTITGIEADPKVFQLLDWNISRRAYAGVTLINKVVSNSDKPVRFYPEGADAGRVHPGASAGDWMEVVPVSLDDLIEGPVDLLKMDIEGSETEAICSSEKLEQVDNLFVEYHSFKDSQQTLGRILEKLSACGFRYYIQTQLCSPRPLTEEKVYLGMDLQLNIFAKRGA